MATARECPACGHRHRLDTIPTSGTFRCEQCGQVLKAPSSVSSEPGAPPPPARGSAPPSRAGAPAPVAPPPRRTAPDPGREPTGDPATREAPVRTAAGVSATVAATAAAPDPNGADPGRSGRRGELRRPQPVPTAAPAKRSKVAWYWRLVAWIVAVPVAFLVTAWPAYKFGFIKKDDLLDIFVGTGASRYFRIAIVTLVWAVVTALLVQLLVEGGRARANRRRRSRAAAA
jgi:hypothetical protein